MKLLLFKFKLFIFYCRLQYRKLLKYGKENVLHNLFLLLIGIVASVLKICSAMARGGTTIISPSGFHDNKQDGNTRGET
jgi:hypothetical protein